MIEYGKKNHNDDLYAILMRARTSLALAPESCAARAQFLLGLLI
jgi:hypothetical protein